MKKKLFGNTERSDRQNTVQGVEAQGGVALYRDWEAADHEKWSAAL